MQVPRIEKVVVNVGCGEARDNAKVLDAVVREIREETGMNAVRIRFNRTKFFEPSNTLMINFTAFVDDADAIAPNEEIDRYSWFTPDEARQNIRPNSLAAEFLNAYLDETHE